MRHLFLALSLTACAGGDGGDQPTDVPTSEAVTWYADIVPIMQRSCWRCHSADGVGTGDFSTWEAARGWASVMAGAVAEGAMPPPAADPTCRDYAGSELFHLSAEERALFAAWAEGGAPEGDPADAPPAPEEQTLATDLDLPLPGPHPVESDADANQYYCYVVDSGRTDSFTITGFDVRLDNAEVVHHMLLLRDPTGGDGAERYGGPGPDGGFPCREPIMANEWELLHAWAPGMPPTEFPSGFGMTIEPTDQLIVQMHYFSPPGSGALDQTHYALRTQPQSARSVFMLPLGPYDFLIPAGDPDFSWSWGLDYDYPLPLKILGVFPHMHLLGKAYSGRVVHPDDSEECMAEGAYAFDYQMTYMFREPMDFGPGDRFEMSCSWDNSTDNPRQPYDPPHLVHFGDGTTDEMCLFLTYVGL